MKAQIVCGSNFGDEGKGMTVDYLSSLSDNTIVVRFNGGANAGHTVQTEKTRHVFSHFGSGTLLGVPTFLSKYFVVDPVAFSLELNELLEYVVPMIKYPILYVDRNAYLTTPYDSMINILAEKSRGEGKHGSCGYGINETVTRHADQDIYNHNDMLDTTVADLDDLDALRAKLYYIRDVYVPQRLHNLGIDNAEFDLSDEPIDEFLFFCGFFKRDVIIVSDASILLQYDTVVFEGAQGLLLDEYHRWFPHVTRSRTGVFNAVQILKSIGVYEADVFYVTRTFLTRHGRGPLPLEQSDSTVFSGIVDATNVPNKHQETIRYAPLNLPLLSESINSDLKTVLYFTFNVNLSVTWVDYLVGKIPYVDMDGRLRVTNDTSVLIGELSSTYTFDRILLSNGHTRSSFYYA